jgi:coenzyme F420-reducing hydrogenase delta subunit
MTIADLDASRVAKMLLERHGRDAAIVAAQHADECLAVGNVDGQAAWKRIVEAVIELLKDSPDEGERVN